MTKRPIFIGHKSPILARVSQSTLNTAVCCVLLTPSETDLASRIGHICLQPSSTWAWRRNTNIHGNTNSKAPLIVLVCDTAVVSGRKRRRRILPLRSFILDLNITKTNYPPLPHLDLQDSHMMLCKSELIAVHSVNISVIISLFWLLLAAVWLAIPLCNLVVNNAIVLHWRQPQPDLLCRIVWSSDSPVCPPNMISCFLFNSRTRKKARQFKETTAAWLYANLSTQMAAIIKPYSLTLTVGFESGYQFGAYKDKMI